MAKIVLFVLLMLSSAFPTRAEWYQAERPPKTVLIYTAAMGAGPQPVLSVQCSGLETSLTVHWHQPMAGYYTQAVAYTIDSLSPRIAQWRLSTDKTTLGSWGPEAIPLALLLIGKTQLSVRAITRRGSAVIANFNVVGLERAVTSVAHACRWPRR